MEQEQVQMQVAVNEAGAGAYFNFSALPVEIQHEILKKQSTVHLRDVCALVCQEWEGMVGDLLEQKRINLGQIIPEFYRQELELKTVQQVSGDPIEMVTFYENCELTEHFAATSVEVNDDVLESRAGMVFKLWKFRGGCECVEITECVMRRVNLVPMFNVFILDCDADYGGPRFFGLSELEKLDRSHTPHTRIRRYSSPRIEEWIGPGHQTNSGLSVCKDHIVAEIAAKTLLLLKIVSVDHEAREVDIERVRIIHLPLWTSGICLFEDKVVVLYTTGHVGMWDKKLDELFISSDKCFLGEIKPAYMHRTKLYRIGSLVLIKTNCTGEGSQQWYVVDSKNSSLRIHAINMLKLMNQGVIPGTTYLETLDVYHVDIWCDCFIIHLKVKGASPVRTACRLVFKRIKRYPTVEDFLSPEKFTTDFLSLNANKRLVSVPADFRIAFTSPFIPPSLQTWQVEPQVGEPVPIADLVGAQLTPMDRALEVPRNYIKAFRIRISNLPPDIQIEDIDNMQEENEDYM